MINPVMPRNLSFRVETTYMKNPGKLGRVRCNDHGVYTGIPMMYLGETTQQNTYYDPASIVDQITNPDRHFCKVLTQGKKRGEWGHPQFYGMSDNDKLTRLMTVEDTNVSHMFTSIYTGNPTPEGYVPIYGDLKPTGPMGQYLKENLDDPIANTAFSLRAFVDTRVEPTGKKVRTVKSLATFDTVGASGYFGTDKAHAIGLESFAGDEYHDYEISVMADGNLMIDQIALESFEDTALNEIFGVSSIQQIIQSRTFVQRDPEVSQKFPGLYQNAIFNEFFKEG